ncbi:MAG: hypothetical protein ACRD0W_03315 [Acidimicrobiales bacterium]
MTRTTASDYDAAAADLVVRTLRAVADATPIDSTPVNVDPSMLVLPGADVDRPIRRHRRVQWLVGMAAAAAAALVVAAVWTRDDRRVETSPPSEPPPDAASRPLAEEQVVARGEVDGRLWRLDAQPFENGLICVELTGGGGGCGSAPTSESPLGSVFHTGDSIEGSRFVFGTVVREAAEVAVELANGEELSVDLSQPTFGLRFYVIPVPAGPDAVAAMVLDDEGRELQRVELKGVEVPPPR